MRLEGLGHSSPGVCSEPEQEFWSHGYCIGPVEVESALAKHPAVAEGEVKTGGSSHLCVCAGKLCGETPQRLVGVCVALTLYGQQEAPVASSVTI